MLAREDGDSIPLLLDDNAAKTAGPAGGLLALDRKRITVSGDWSGALSPRRTEQGVPGHNRASVESKWRPDKS
jgi:hypothetical protein